MAHKTIAQMFEDVVNAYHSFDTAAQIYDRECHTLPLNNRKNRVTLRNAFNTFERSMQDNDVVVQGFLVIYDSRIQSLYNLFRQQHFSGIDFLPRFRAIFLSNLIDTTSANTKLFNEFIKGITFFQNEIDYPINRVPRPLYHRNLCCGANDGPIRNVEKCYIERLIYDAIFRKFGMHFPEVLNSNDNQRIPSFDNRFFQNRQDDGHEHWLFNVVKQLYHTKYPEVENVELEVNSGIERHIPLTLSIKKTLRNGRYVEDHYEKIYRVTMGLNQVYEENVLCRRKDIRDGNMKLYHKTQTFERENMWVENVVGGKKKATN